MTFENTAHDNDLEHVGHHAARGSAACTSRRAGGTRAFSYSGVVKVARVSGREDLTLVDGGRLSLTCRPRRPAVCQVGPALIQSMILVRPDGTRNESDMPEARYSHPDWVQSAHVMVHAHERFTLTPSHA
jgi:hypothetical protein